MSVNATSSSYACMLLFCLSQCYADQISIHANSQRLDQPSTLPAEDDQHNIFAFYLASIPITLRIPESCVAISGCVASLILLSHMVQSVFEEAVPTKAGHAPPSHYLKTV